MRKWVPLLLGIALVPALAATVRAQVPPLERGKPPKMEARRIPEAQARATALARVRSDLAGSKLNGGKQWGGGTGGIPPASLVAQGALFNPTGGKGGTPVFVVGVGAPNATGHVRVIVDARTGAVLDVAQSAFQWGVAPAYWQRGLSSPPPARP